MKDDFYLKDVIESKYELDFGIAEMDFQLPEFIRDYMFNIRRLGYGNPDSRKYRESINKWFYIQYNKNINEKYFLYTNSVKYGIKKLMDIFDEATILNFIPCYNGYSDIFLNKYRVYEFNYLDLFKKNFSDNLEKFIIENKINCILISNPHNPTGEILCGEKLNEIVNLCSKLNIYMIIDEAHGDIVQKEFYSAININYEKCIVAKTIGKSFNMSGIGGAYLVISNKNIYDEILFRIEKDGLSSPNVFSYRLTECVYSKKGKKWLDDINDKILKNKLYLKKELDTKFKNKLRYEITYGSYLAWINYENLEISEELFESILKAKKIKVIFASKYKTTEKYFRVNLACETNKITKFICELEKIINTINV